MGTIFKIIAVILILLVIIYIAAAIYEAYNRLGEVFLHSKYWSNDEAREENLYRSRKQLITFLPDYEDFKGWYTEPDGKGVQVTDENGYILAMPKDGDHLYAYHVPHEYVFNVADEDGNVITSYTLRLGDDLPDFTSAYEVRKDYDVSYVVNVYYDKTIGGNGVITDQFKAFDPYDYGWSYSPEIGARVLTVKPVYTLKKYQISVVYPEGTPSIIEFQLQKELYSVAPRTINGKTFVGYARYKDAELDDILPEDEVYTSSATVYAIYRDNVTLNLGGVRHTFYEGQEATLPAPETIPVGKELAGWEFDDKTYGSDVYTKLSITKALQGVLMSPAWRNTAYNITYYSGGEVVHSETYGYGDSRTISHTEAKIFYTFDGWYTSDKLTGDKFTEITPETHGDISLYAKFTPKSYTVMLDPLGGNISDYEKTITYGTSFSIPAPTRTGREFVGWYYLGPTGEKIFVTDKKGVSLFTFDAEHLDGKSTEAGLEGLNLVAEYETIKYKVTFTVLGEVYATETVDHGSRVSLPETPSIKGYTFVRWKRDGGEYDFDTRVTENVTIEAELQANTYTIILKVKNDEGYILSGGDELTEIRINYTYGQTKIDLTDIVPTREGFDFSGWYLEGVICISPTGSVLLSNLTQALNDDGETVLYANWVSN